MFHLFDTPAAEPALRRCDWMALLARAPMDVLEAGLGEHAQAQPHWLRAPETGLMMVQGRAGGTGERFNLGELTVTRCALRLRGAGRGDVGLENVGLGNAGLGNAGLSNAVGVAYVLGRVHRQARLAAVADALLQDPAQQAGLNERLLTPIRQHLSLKHDQRAADVQATKVEFFTVARETGAPADEGDAE